MSISLFYIPSSDSFSAHVLCSASSCYLVCLQWILFSMKWVNKYSGVDPLKAGKRACLIEVSKTILEVQTVEG